MIQASKLGEIGESNYEIKGLKQFIPKQTTLEDKVIIDVDDQIEEPGFYSLSLQDKKLKNLVFNYDRKESDLSYFGASELKSKYESLGIDIIDNPQDINFTQLIGEKENGVALWKWCLIFALIFLAIETLLIRFWK